MRDKRVNAEGKKKIGRLPPIKECDIFKDEGFPHLSEQTPSSSLQETSHTYQYYYVNIITRIIHVILTRLLLLFNVHIVVLDSTKNVCRYGGADVILRCFCLHSLWYPLLIGCRRQNIGVNIKLYL